LKAHCLRPQRSRKVSLDFRAESDHHQEATLVVRLHWIIIILAPVLTVLTARPSDPVIWYALGLLVLSTASFQTLISLRPSRIPWPGLGYAIIVSDLLFVTGLVWAKGGLVTDAYHFYYLVIVGSAVLFGSRESVGCAVLAGLLYGAVSWATTGEVEDLARAGTRTIYFVLTGALAAYLSRQAKRHRVARAETQRQLTTLQEAHSELKVFAREMSQRAVTDGLTGLYNHTFFYQRLDEELNRSDRYHRSVSLLMLDLDDFKNYNDTYGHPKGDLVLSHVARVIAESVRKADVVCRYGGEEFAVILPETDTPAAQAVGERIRAAVAANLLSDESDPAGNNGFVAPHGDGNWPRSGRPAPGRLTVSIGVATHPTHSDDRAGLVDAADRAVYVSKRQGKNRVSVSNGQARSSADA
jgi:diguanylate cyclase (GGDEF)-like protein